MNIDQATEMVRTALILALLLSAPMLVIGLVVGIIISLVQAVTQIQEQTLSFVPKIAAMVAAAIFLLPWIGQRLLADDQVRIAGQFAGADLPGERDQVREAVARVDDRRLARLGPRPGDRCRSIRCLTMRARWPMRSITRMSAALRIGT